MKVLLINPPTGIYDRADRCQAPVKEEGIEMIRPPMDLAYMAAMVEKGGKRAVIRDYPAEKKNWLDFENDLRELDPEILVLSTTLPTLHNDLLACLKAKTINHEILTIAKGAHLYECSREILGEFPSLDVAIKDEPEMIVYEIIKSKSLRKVRGITYRQGKKIIENPKRLFLTNLDQLPFPARHLLNSNLYRFPDTNEPYALIVTGRGCPASCIFCLVGRVSGKRLRQRSVENVLQEMEVCLSDFHLKTFFFRADTFTWDKNWVISFSQEIIKRGWKIRWGTNSRVDTLDEEMVTLMKKAGCDIIGLGIESGCQKILDQLKKGITLNKARTAVELCVRHGIKTLLFFILGLPWDDKETIEETIRFAKELPGTFYNFSIAYPFPGTELAKIAEENKLLVEKNLVGYNYAHPAMRTFFLESEEIVYYRQKALREMYYRPSYIWRVLKGTHSFKELTNYSRYGLIKTLKLIAYENSVN